MAKVSEELLQIEDDFDRIIVPFFRDYFNAVAKAMIEEIDELLGITDDADDE